MAEKPPSKNACAQPCSVPTHLSRGVLLVALGLLFTIAAPAGTQTPVSSPFLLNQETSGSQRTPRLASLGDGSFVAVWASLDAQDGDEGGVFGRWFNSDCQPASEEIQLNAYTTGSQYRPDLGIDDTGRVVVLWNSVDQGLVGRIFLDARPIGGEFVVEPVEAGLIGHPLVSVAPDGAFLVSWSIDESPLRSVWARTYDSNGDAEGPRIPISATANFSASAPGALTSDHDFFVTWQSTGENGLPSVWGRRFDSERNVLEPAFEVGQPAFGYHSYAPRLAADASGQFRVVWQEQIHLGRADLVSRPVDEGGPGPPAHVAARTGTFAMDTAGNGDFVVAYSDYYGYSIDGRLVDADSKLQPPFEIATGTSPYLGVSGLAVRGANPREFVVSWDASEVPGGPRDAFARCFRRMFADGFESGDTSAWSISLP